MRSCAFPDLAALEKVTRLSLLDLKENRIEDLGPLKNQTELKMLFLERNQIRDLSPLLKMVQADADGPKRMAPFLRLYLEGNPLSDEARTRQLETCKAALSKEELQKGVGYPFLAVLDADGKVVTAQRTDPLEVGDHHDPKRVAELLTRWKVPPKDAKVVLEEALSRAASDDKRVFLTFGAPWCGWYGWLGWKNCVSCVP